MSGSSCAATAPSSSLPTPLLHTRSLNIYGATPSHSPPHAEKKNKKKEKWKYGCAPPLPHHVAPETRMTVPHLSFAPPPWQEYFGRGGRRCGYGLRQDTGAARPRQPSIEPRTLNARMLFRAEEGRGEREWHWCTNAEQRRHAWGKANGNDTETRRGHPAHAPMKVLTEEKPQRTRRRWCIALPHPPPRVNSNQ